MATSTRPHRSPALFRCPKHPTLLASLPDAAPHCICEPKRRCRARQRRLRWSLVVWRVCAWHVARGAWCLARGAWRVELGVWCSTRGAWRAPPRRPHHARGAGGHHADRSRQRANARTLCWLTLISATCAGGAAAERALRPSRGQHVARGSAPLLPPPLWHNRGESKRCVLDCHYAETGATVVSM